MIYFTSDLHLGDNRLLKYRPQFSNIDEMNEALINAANCRIDSNDTLFILGDLFEGINVSEANRLVKKINGHKILIRGNHDLEYDTKLFEGISDYMEITHNGITYIMSHYPFMAWKKMKEGSIQLHGHIHSSSDHNMYNHSIGRLQYDVGVDANYYRPISIKEIDLWCQTAPWREYKGIDHHTKSLKLA